MPDIKNDNTKKFTTADWIGAIIGFSIATVIFSLGSFGLIPALIIAYGSYWIFKKIAQMFLKS